MRRLIAALALTLITAATFSVMPAVGAPASPPTPSRAPTALDTNQVHLISMHARNRGIGFNQAKNELDRFFASLSAPAPTSIGGPCAQWWPTAQSVGWSLGEFRSMQHIMYRESNCNPGVRSEHGHGCCYGLLQIHYMHVIGQPGCPSRNYCTMLYNPSANLRAGLALLHGSGKRPWSL